MEKSPDPEKDSLLLEDSLAFFGAITASVSHELNNVVSILNQTGGLLEDLLAGAREGRSIKNERLARIAETFRVQTERGIGIIKRLNKFSHSADEPAREYNVNETVENLVCLAQRPASLKKTELAFVPPAEPVQIVGNPFMMQQALFGIIRMALSAVQGNETLTFSLERHGNDAKLEMRGLRCRTEPRFDLSSLDILLNHIGGEVTCRSEGEEVVFELSIPRGERKALSHS
jgi:C4-dicarboxylate-specific signal transduction histidine kinase